jgi:truncated hemoglobin YjbI
MEYRLKVFENKVLRRIFGPKREMTGGWRKLNEKLHNLYSSPSKIRMIQVKEDEMDRKCSKNGEKSDAYRIMVENRKERDH